MKVAAALGLAAIAICLTGCARPQLAAPSAEAAAKADTAGAREGTLAPIKLTADAVRRLGIATTEIVLKDARLTRMYAGELSVPPDQLISVSAVVNGFFQLDAETLPGANVRAGQRLFRLTPALFTKSGATVEARSIDIPRDDAEADRLAIQVSRARSEYGRQQELLQKGSGTAQAVETARKELAALETAAATAKKSEYWVALEGGSQYEFTSPHGGVVMQVLAMRGQYVTNGAPLIKLASLDRLWVRVPVYSGDLPRIDRSAAASVRSLGADRGAPSIAAKAIAGPPTADAATSTRDVYYELTNPHGTLRPGERVNVYIPVGDGVKRLTTARGSVIYDVNGGAWVYESVAPAEFVRRRVEVDYTTEGAAVLSSGPPEGAHIVSAGAAQLYSVEFGAGK